MLLVKTDDYIESLNSVLNSTKNYLQNEIVKIANEDHIFLPTKKPKKSICKKDDNVIQETVSKFNEVENESDYLSNNDHDVNTRLLNETETNATSPSELSVKPKSSLLGVDKTILFQNKTEQIYFLNMGFSKEYQKLKEQLFCKVINATEYYEKIYHYLSEVKTNLCNSLNLCTSAFKNLKQIWLFKNGLFQILSELLNFMNYVLKIEKHQKKQDEINKILIEVLAKIVEDNSFLSSLFFSEKSLNLNFNIKESEKYLFYLGLLKTLRKDIYKINFRTFIDVNSSESILNNVNYLKLSLQLLKRSEPGKVEITPPVTVLGIYLKMLQLASSNCKERVNEYIYEQLSTHSVDIETLYQLYIQKISPEDEDKNNDNNAVYPEKLEKIIILLNKVILNMSNNYSYLLIKNFSKEIYVKITKILKAYNRLSPELRINFTKLFTKIYIKLPYEIKEKVIINDRTHYPAFSINSNPVEEPIFDSLKNFPIVYYSFENENFLKNPRFILKYFLHSILNPITDVFYKILYFSESITNDTKYKIYKGLVLFLKSYKVYIRNI